VTIFKDLADDVCGVETLERASTYCCGPRTYQLTPASLAETAPFLTFDESKKEFRAITSDQGMVGEYKVEMTVSLRDYPKNKKVASPSFGITVAKCQPLSLNSSFSVYSIDYKVGDPALTLQMPTFTQTPKCGYEIKVSAKNMPAGVTYEDGALKVDITKEAMVGSYTVML